jgi:hypothetical protein
VASEQDPLSFIANLLSGKFTKYATSILKEDDLLPGLFDYFDFQSEPVLKGGANL